MEESVGGFFEALIELFVYLGAYIARHPEILFIMLASMIMYTLLNDETSYQ